MAITAKCATTSSPESTKRINTIFLDMDGVLCDFVSDALSYWGMTLEDLIAAGVWQPGEYDICQVIDIPPPTFWSLLDSKGYDFWGDLAPYPWLNDLINLVTSYCDNCFIVTFPTGSNSAAGKLRWVREHLPAWEDRVILTKHKYLLAAPDRLLIDDSGTQIDRFYYAGGKTILFPQHWNSMHYMDSMQGLREGLAVLCD